MERARPAGYRNPPGGRTCGDSRNLRRIPVQIRTPGPRPPWTANRRGRAPRNRRLPGADGRSRRGAGSFQIDDQQRQERTKETLGLANWQSEDESKSQRSLDGQVGVLLLTAATARRPRLPRGYRLSREPERHVASSDEGRVVFCPVRDAVPGLVSGMASRAHALREQARARSAVIPRIRRERQGRKRPTCRHPGSRPDPLASILYGALGNRMSHPPVPAGDDLWNKGESGATGSSGHHGLPPPAAGAGRALPRPG